MNLTTNQILSIAAAVLAALIAGTSQLSDIFNPAIAKTIVSAASLGNMILTGVLAGLTSQKAQVQNVSAMPGVEKITVNTQASPALAQVAIDPNQMKVGGTTDKVQETLKDIAKGN